jgi:uncharacterized protein DUF2064
VDYTYTRRLPRVSEFAEIRMHEANPQSAISRSAIWQAFRSFNPAARFLRLVRAASPMRNARGIPSAWRKAPGWEQSRQVRRATSRQLAPRINLASQRAASCSPTLPVEHVRRLLKSEADVSLGPTLDGGYYGIACRKIHQAMFDAVRWSTSETLQDTARAVERCGLSHALGPEWFDVDTPEDLRRLTGYAAMH